MSTLTSIHSSCSTSIVFSFVSSFFVWFPKSQLNQVPECCISISNSCPVGYLDNKLSRYLSRYLFGELSSESHFEGLYPEATLAIDSIVRFLWENGTPKLGDWGRHGKRTIYNNAGWFGGKNPGWFGTLIFLIPGPSRERREQFPKHREKNCRDRTGTPTFWKRMHPTFGDPIGREPGMKTPKPLSSPTHVPTLAHWEVRG